MTDPLEFEPYMIEGRGDDYLDGVAVPNDVPALIRMQHHGSSNFVVKTIDSAGGLCDYPANTIGRWDGVRTVNISQTPFSSIEIQADGAWRVSIGPVFAAPPVEETMSGAGDKVFFRFDDSPDASAATLRTTSDSNIVLQGYDDYFNWELLVNEIGPYQGRVRWRGHRLYSIYCEGSWTVELENGVPGGRNPRIQRL